MERPTCSISTATRPSSSSRSANTNALSGPTSEPSRSAQTAPRQPRVRPLVSADTYKPLRVRLRHCTPSAVTGGTTRTVCEKRFGFGECPILVGVALVSMDVGTNGLVALELKVRGRPHASVLARMPVFAARLLLGLVPGLLCFAATADGKQPPEPAKRINCAAFGALCRSVTDVAQRTTRTARTAARFRPSARSTPRPAWN